MGFGRQNGHFACLNVSDGSQRWDWDVQASCSDVVTCDVDGDGKDEFIFGTSHGAIYAVGDDDGKPRIVWKIDTAAVEGTPILADVLGSGRPQIIVPSVDGQIRIYGEAAAALAAVIIALTHQTQISRAFAGLRWGASDSGASPLRFLLRRFFVIGF